MPIDDALAQLGPSIIIPIANLENYIILEGKNYNSHSYPDLLVSIEKKYHGSNWRKTQELLSNEESFMLNPRQFCDFIILLLESMFTKQVKVYNGKGNALNYEKVNYLLRETIKHKNEWRGEFLDAKFKNINDEWYMDFNHKIIGGELVANNTELLPLDEILRVDNGYINLLNCNYLGLPKPFISNVKEDIIYYYSPGDNSIATMRLKPEVNAISLDCNTDIEHRHIKLGVRPVKIR